MGASKALAFYLVTFPLVLFPGVISKDSLGDGAVLLAWKATLPEGQCLGCQNGPVFRNWNSASNLCDWWEATHVNGEEKPQIRGVTRCSKSRQEILVLNLEGMDISSPLPDSFHEFLQITDLVLNGNRFAGSLPGSWSALGLESPDVSVELDDNFISGTLPNSWSEHRSLTSLSLDHNKLTGDLPREWSAISSIHRLSVCCNSIVETFPETWSSLDELSSLTMNKNRISGSLPATWSAMKGLKRMKASDNELIGSIPAEWSAMQHMTNLLLAENELTGTLPTEIITRAHGNPPLDALDVIENKMDVSGWLPETWQVHPQRTEPINHHIDSLLEWVSSLPSGGCLGCADGPVLANFSKSRSVCDWHDWVAIPGREDLQHRGVTRCNSAEQEIVKLDLEGMGISGTLPITLGHQYHLTDLVLAKNHFRGTLPLQWSVMGRLSDDLEINLDGNDLEGQLPAAWGAFGSTLYKLKAKHNKLTGTLPSTWSEAELLKVLDLRWNQLQGTLPGSWSMLGALGRALLQGNALSGPLPEEWAALSKLTHLDLSNNMLTLTLPKAWSELSSSELDLSGNDMLIATPHWVPDFWKLKPQKTQVRGSGGALKTSLSTLAVGVVILAALAGLVGAAIFAVRRKKSGPEPGDEVEFSLVRGDSQQVDETLLKDDEIDLEIDDEDQEEPSSIQPPQTSETV